MISSDEYTCAGKVTEVRVEGSELGLRATVPFLVFCTTLHHVGVHAKWKSGDRIIFYYRRIYGEIFLKPTGSAKEVIRDANITKLLREATLRLCAPPIEMLIAERKTLSTGPPEGRAPRNQTR